MSVILFGASESVCELVRSALRRRVPDARVERAETVDGLLDRAKSLRPDALVVDESYLGEEAGRFLGAVRAIRATLPIVIVAIDGSGPLTRWEGAIEASADEQGIEAAIEKALGMIPLQEALEAVPDLEERTELHRVRNRLAGLVVGIRALGADLDAAAANPEEVRRIVVDYKARLGFILSDIRKDPNEACSREPAH
jgi:DNA-binding NarL/FixJ family response regulator